MKLILRLDSKKHVALLSRFLYWIENEIQEGGLTNDEKEFMRAAYIDADKVEFDEWTKETVQEFERFLEDYLL